MAAALGQNKTMRSLVLTDSSGRPFRSGFLVSGSQIESDLTQYSAVKQFMKYLLLGVSRNSTLEEVKLQLSCLSGFIKRNDTQQHLKNITLERVTLDAMCDVVVNFEHMKELQCMKISDPQESLSLDLLNKMSTSLAQNNTMMKLVLHCQYLTQKEDVKLFTHHLLLGLSSNTTLTDLSLYLPEQCWDWLQEGNLVPRHVKRVTLGFVPLDLVCDVVKLLEHVEELHCVDIWGPQQSLSLDHLSKMTSSLAQNNTMVKLVLHCQNLTQKVDVKLFTHHLLLGLSTNTTLTDLSLSLPEQCWDWLQEGNLVPRHVKRVTLGFVSLDFVCDVVKVFEHVEDLRCVDIRGPQQTLSPDLLSKMAAALGQNKTMRFLVLNDSGGRLFESGLTQYSAVKQFVKYLLLGVSRNSTLEEVKLQLSCLSGFIKCDDTLPHLKNITLERVTLDVVCDVVLNFEHMKELQCMRISDPQESLSLDLLNKISTSLAQNKTMVKLTIQSYDLAQVQDGKLFFRHLLLGLSGNNTLTDLTLSFQHDCWDWPEGNLVQRSVERVSLMRIPLDFECEALKFFGHVKELQCTDIMNPQQSLSLDLLNKMSTSLAQNKTMVKLELNSSVDSPEDGKLFTRHILLGLSGNNTLTDLTLLLHSPWWDWPEGNLVQRSLERVSLHHIRLDLVCNAIGFFGHVKELKCHYFRPAQQSGVAEDGLKLEELEGKLAGHESLKKLSFHFGYEAVPQTLVQKFGVGAVRGVARNKSIAEFKLETCKSGPQVVDGILVQLTADERRKFRVGKDYKDRPSIELCALGDPSSGGAPPSTDSQPISEDTVMDLDRPEHPTSAMTGMIPEEEEVEEESPSPAKKIRKLQNDEEEGDGTGVSEDHSKATSSSATAAVNQRDDTAMSSSYSGSYTDDDGSAPLTPPSFTRVGGAPHWGETSAGTDLSYIHPQTAKYLMKASARPKEKVGWAGGAGEGAPLASVKNTARTVVLLVRPLPTADGNWVKSHSPSNSYSNPFPDEREISTEVVEAAKALILLAAAGSRKGKRSATGGAPFLAKKGRGLSG